MSEKTLTVREKSTGRTQFLRELENNPALPALVERLAAPELRKLIDHIGLEDAGAIVALTSPQQLAGVLDDVLWTSVRPGDQERLSIEEFVRWLDLWNDIGDDFTGEKLHDLGDEFCAACFSRLTSVVETDVVPPFSDDYSVSYGVYLVRPQYDDEWDAVLEAMNQLWSEYPDFLLGVLGRFCFRHSVIDMDDAAPGAQLRAIQADEAGTREANRTRQGFVVSADAGAFLSSVRETDLASLASAQDYDMTTTRLFQSVESGGRPEGEPTDRATDIDDAALDALQRALEDAEIVSTRQRLLLTGPEDARTSSVLRDALATLQGRNPDAFSARMNELAYLSNVLIVGTTHNDEPFQEGPAATAAMATCCLGAEFLARRAEVDDLAAELLADAPGLVKAFSVGFHLISRLPRSAVRQLRDVFQQADVRNRYATAGWVLREVDALLDARFVNVIERADFADAKETLRVLSIAMDDQAVYCLRVLVDAFPSFPLALERSTPAGETIDSATRFIDCLADLKQLDAFLGGLGRFAHF